MYHIGGEILGSWWRRIIGLLLLGIIITLLINASWFLKIFYPFPHKELLTDSCLKYQVDIHLALAVMRVESRFYADAKSRAGAKGLMQIMPKTGEWIASQLEIADYTEDMLYQPDYNIAMGVWYLSYLQKVFQGDMVQMLAAYNAGESKVQRWLNEGIWQGSRADLNQIPYQETRKYVVRVLFDYEVYQRIYPDDQVFSEVAYLR